MRFAMGMIESPGFAAATGVASDLDTMLRAANAAAVQTVARAMRSSPRNQLLVMQRALALVHRDCDLRYQNPYDAAITVYLWLLSLISPTLAEVVSASTLGLRNGWWAPRLARRLLTRQLSAEADSITTTSPGQASWYITLGLEAQNDPEIRVQGVERYWCEPASMMIADVRTAQAPGLASPSASSAMTTEDPYSFISLWISKVETVQTPTDEVSALGVAA